jgi:hypothetical protein
MPPSLPWTPVLTDVVVLGGLDALLAVDGLGEVVEGARVGARPKALDLQVGEALADLTPVRRRTLGAPDRADLVDGEALGEIVLRVEHDRERIVGHRDLLELDAALLAGCGLILVDLARGVGDVGLSPAERLEAAAGARGADVDVHAGVLVVEELRGRLAERRDRRGAVEADAARELLAA